jgi:CheY-like chemotaxis protein
MLDLNLPKRDGWYVLAEQRCDPVLKNISFVVMSTAPASKNEQRAVASGALGYIQKGLDFNALIRQAQLLHQLYKLNGAD